MGVDGRVGWSKNLYPKPTLYPYDLVGALLNITGRCLNLSRLKNSVN
jgi:hypothetical protein